MRRQCSSWRLYLVFEHLLGVFRNKSLISKEMAFFEGGAKASEQVQIGVINCAPPLSRQRVDLNVEIESAHDEKTGVAVDPLSSRGINKFHLESDLGH